MTRFGFFCLVVTIFVLNVDGETSGDPGNCLGKCKHPYTTQQTTNNCGVAKFDDDFQKWVCPLLGSCTQVDVVVGGGCDPNNVDFTGVDCANSRENVNVYSYTFISCQPKNVAGAACDCNWLPVGTPTVILTDGCQTTALGQTPGCL